MTFVFLEPEDQDQKDFWRDWTKGELEKFREALEDEFGKFTVVDIGPETCRVRVVPEEAASREEWQVAYPSHYLPNARLIVDDYAPENQDASVNPAADATVTP